MATTSTPALAAPRPAAATTLPRVMLLSVWSDVAPGTAWHARLVWPDARSREFHSPFELAQFLGQAGRNPDEPPAGSGGLR